MTKRTIAIFTGNRSEYGLQYPILKAINEHPNLEYKLLVSGAHLNDNFGSTLSEIQRDGFEVHAEIQIEMDANSLLATAQAIGSGVLAISEVLASLKPDIIVVYGDRFEGFAAVIAATQMNIPTAHIEGGDITEGGALDDSVRHAMSKLSHLHFTTNTQATNRVLGMGEESWRVHTVGFPAIDLISVGQYADSKLLEKAYSLDLEKPVILFTQHSVTTEFDSASQQIRPAIEALEALAQEGVQVICTYPNNDAGGKAIIQEIDELAHKKIKGIQVHRSLGRFNYHGILALAQDQNNRVVCVGNSSSGIKETPVFGCPTVNIGSRQAGRLRGSNVIDASYSKTEIIGAVNTCIQDMNFRKICRETNNPYFLGGAGEKIASVLAEVDLNSAILRKKMTLQGKNKEGWFN